MKVKSKEDKTKSKRNIILMIILAVLLIIAIIGITYAWFSATVSGNDSSKENVVENATLSIKYTNSNELKGENIIPGWSETKTFTVENTGTATATYSIAWANLLNEFINKEDLVYTLTSDNSGGTLEETVLPQSGKDINILSDISIAPKVTQTYTLTINYKNKDKDQTSDTNKRLLGKIEVKTAADNAENKCKVELNTNKGTLAESIKEVEKNSAVEIDITNHGYSNPTVTCTNNQEATIKNNTLTIAKLTNDTVCDLTYNTAVQYTINFNLDGATLETPLDNYTIESEDITLPNAIKEGYVFNGWKTGEDDTPQKNLVLSKGSYGDKTYIADFSPIKYQVTFNANGGEGTIENSEFTYDKDSSLPDSTLTKEGYAFVGWSTNPNATEAEYKDGEEVKNLTTTTEVTLYAVWRKKRVITINTNGAESTSETTLECIENKDGECKVTLPNITPQEGFEVLGWSTNPNATTAEANVGDKVTIDDDTIYYPITKSSQPLSAIFKPNGATIDNVTTDITKTCYRYNGANTCDITTPNITREGWTIIGWGTKEDAESSTNEVNSSISINSNITRYAVTKKNIYITYFDDDDNQLYEEGHTVYNNQHGFFHEIISLELDSREGYDFRGWSEIKNDTEIPWAYGDESYFTESTNLYPVWKIKTYTANVTVLNGTVDGETSKEAEQGSNATFTVNASTGYGNPEVTCTNNQNAEITGTTLTVSNVSNDTTCTVEYIKVTSEACFNFNSSLGAITAYHDYEGGGTSGTACPKDVVIPSTINGVNVNQIGPGQYSSGVFAGKGLTSVVLPNGLTQIFTYTFIDNNLTSIEIPSSVTYIARDVFDISTNSNPNLTSIINKTGRSFDWKMITIGTSGNNFVTGSFTTPTNKTLTVSAS